MSAIPESDIVGEPAVASDLPPGAESFVIIKQDVELEVNFREKSISGVSTIHLFTINPDLDEIYLDARQCEIDVDNITVDGLRTSASFSDPYDLAVTPRQWQIGAAQHHVVKKRMAPLKPAKRPEVPNKDREMLPCCVPADRALKVSLRPNGMFNEPRRTLKIKTLRIDKDTPLDRPDPNDEKNGIKVSVPFRSKHLRDGLHFVGVEEGDMRYPHVYTRHSLEPGTASCLFPCVDDPGSRHPWKISIKCPRTLGDVFEQPLATQQADPQTASASRKRKFGEPLPSPPPSPTLVEEDKLMEMTVVCSGNLAGEQIDPQDDKKKIMTFESQLSAAQHIAFAIGPFEHIQLWSEFRTEEADEKLGANAAKIHAYCLPTRAHEVRHTCAPIVPAADFFAPEFGRYPFESYKLVFVEDQIPDTVAATSMSLCSTRLLYTDEIIDPEIDVTRKLVHALASQYFGVHIVPNQRSDSWLIVGIQWFMTDLFMRSLCGNNWYRFHLKTLSDKLVETDIHRPSLHDLGEHLNIGDFELDFMALKAPLVLYILDQRMSKIAGSTGIVRVISQIVSNANINATITSTSLSDADFRRACEKKSQYRPDELWDQWVYSAGCPKLMIKQRFNKKNLNVDISISQTQAKDNGPKAITKDEFLKELLEEVHEVWAGVVPKLFTGPFTVRIHEADGTPYEHFLTITDKDKGTTTLQIAYNTKYKRMKRTKKATAAAALNAADKHDIQEDDIVYFNMLGDVLMTPKDIKDWGLQDWADNVQTAMDQESYEWIRLDCNFEWLCETVTDMPGYMYLAQLQQDRDVVAHQDAMLFFKRGKRHGVASTVETRTVMDRRYYHGIRTMAVEDLPKQADPDLNYIGTAQLILTFRHFFCERMVGKNGSITFPPLPNDFSDRAQYAVQCALPGAIARTRENGRCSRHARNFLLDLLLFNDNSDNDYSDHFYVAKLLDAVTTSIIPDRWEYEKDLLSTLRTDDDDDAEFRRFIEKTIEEIDKYRRMDEWTSTYKNIWTTTALHCKMRLMKARVIPLAPIEFVQYLQEGNLDLIRIEAFDCLVELGFLAKVPIMKLLLASVSSDPSPFIRDRLFKIFCKGIAAVALGESKAAQTEPDQLVDDSGLVVELGEAEIQQRKLDATRSQSIPQAVAALKEELKGNTELQAAMWRAVESPQTSVKEKFQLLTICSAMFEADDSLLMTFNYPKFWKCARVPEQSRQTDQPRQPGAKKQCIVKFTMQYRTTPRHQLIMEPPPPPPPPALEPIIKVPEPKKIKISSKQSFSAPSNRTPTPGPLVRKDSISVTVGRPVVPGTPIAGPSDSIAVQRPPARVPTTPLVASPGPITPLSTQPPSIGVKLADKPRPKLLKKRKSEEHELDRPKKLVRTETGHNNRPRKMVTLRFKSWNKLPARIKQEIGLKGPGSAISSTIHATPAGVKRAAISSHPESTSYFGTARPSSPAVPNSRASPAVQSSAVKIRKPLPGAAPRHPLPPSTPAAAGSGSGGETPAPPPPKKILKLKIKPSSQTSPPPPR
ncbi:Transcription initiation factor TFIID subunit 2 [Collariella sp. IMI 366227]|nr:Transcription initiation factor TFIID subunit 2 [Collariella sp. IMI 366227]